MTVMLTFIVTMTPKPFTDEDGEDVGDGCAVVVHAGALMTHDKQEDHVDGDCEDDAKDEDEESDGGGDGSGGDAGDEEADDDDDDDDVLQAERAQCTARAHGGGEGQSGEEGGGLHRSSVPSEDPSLELPAQGAATASTEDLSHGRRPCQPSEGQVDDPGRAVELPALACLGPDTRREPLIQV